MVMLDPTQPQKKPNTLQPPDPNAPPAGVGGQLSSVGGDIYSKAAAPTAGGAGPNIMDGGPMTNSMAAPAPNQVTLGMGANAPAPVPIGGGIDKAVPGPTFTAPAPAPAAGALPAGATDAGNGMVKFADGQVLPRNHPAFAAKMAAAGAPAAPGTPAPTAGQPAGPAPAAGPTTDTAFKDALMKMLNPAAPSLADPALKAQSDAFAVGQTRATEQARNAMAERSAAQGGPGVNSGAFDNGLAGLYQTQGENQAANDAGLVGDARKEQNASLLAALGIGGNYNAANADRAMKGDQFGKSLEEQKREADTDAEMKRLGITSQADLGNKDLNLRDKLGSGQLNLGLSQLLSGNANFKDNLGATLGMHNQDAILKLLGMS